MQIIYIYFRKKFDFENFNVNLIILTISRNFNVNLITLTISRNFILIIFTLLFILSYNYDIKLKEIF